MIIKFDTFFQARKKVIFEHIKLNQCIQKAGESTEQFITIQFAGNCAYGDLEDGLI